MAPSQMKQWTITGTEKGFDGLELSDVPVPKVGENDVLVKIQGASLNYRDLIIPKVASFPFHHPINSTQKYTLTHHPRACTLSQPNSL